ncbi:hypothetical protein RYH70_04045 [Alloalcanivorax xenomutans]|uniref:phosphoribosyltransferase-like protein n=1 Tax=Alloalcanivorax xenomutans TaxID=1094342 RepID=UPI0029342DF1|nr:hypothetical protein [Alloalcanivorax xenomutans]WOD29235.1 hypothetical protein RYH70_04045 [Alloalcanivorax xenomutans]
MKLPDQWEFFYDDICSRVKLLSASGIWPFHQDSLTAWLGNFSKDEHKYIAAHILDRLIFRTEKMTESAYQTFFSTHFRAYVKKNLSGSVGSLDVWLRQLRERTDYFTKEIVICSVTKAGEHGESGSHMLRILSGGILNERYIFPVDTKPLSDLKGKIILIVDDFVGSGSQFFSFAEACGLREAAEKNKIIYAPSMAYCEGVVSINEKKYGIDLYPLEVVSQKDRFFSHKAKANFRGDDINTEKEVIECYAEMRHLNRNFGRGAWFGRDKTSLCVGFQWGCPNQSLGVMWYDGGDDWHKLVRRRGGQ